ncbi:class I SAM-dependent methyltransferase [Umezawaea sp. Da 62-37]|uniref:class I SAM-dependent methyltransferase n=1 Tax=Umezawaea sp. Da 62-37 TaxID=3075927 RepID=UPI0028F72F1C|nr:class I SAM-dependent methyltransferase [Umezawaea sp. Da 62-37]WNV91324.1 class I SAM-dependent methyltransferase [Umezawaea sp. Da 62-37]
MDKTSEEHWEEQSGNWIAWVRRPGLDSYWTYREAFFALVPAPGFATLDFGCGEGRVSRDLVGRGHRVTGFDASAGMVAAAREAHPEGEYLVADAVSLPFEDDSFDLVVAYDVLMDVSDVDGAVREAARVLMPGGRLCLSITHPITDPGDRESPYLTSSPVREAVERDGLPMVFNGWSHPLSHYAGALEKAGLLIEALREPAWQDRPVPHHLWLRARPA